MVKFNSKDLVERIIREHLIEIKTDFLDKNKVISSPIVIGDKEHQMISLDCLNVHGILETEDGKLFAFFSEEEYENITIEYQGKYYSITDVVGEVHYLEHLRPLD